MNNNNNNNRNDTYYRKGRLRPAAGSAASPCLTGAPSPEASIIILI